MEGFWCYTRADVANLREWKRSEKAEAMTLHGVKPQIPRWYYSLIACILVTDSHSNLAIPLWRKLLLLGDS